MNIFIFAENFDFTSIASTYANSIWEIRYDFDLEGISIPIPPGVLIKFRGGSMSNGVLKGDDTQIDASITQIFGNDLEVYGLMVQEVYPEWFGAMKNGMLDDAFAIQKAFSCGAGIVKFQEGIYASSDVTYQNPSGDALEKGLKLRGSGKKKLSSKIFQRMRF